MAQSRRNDSRRELATQLERVDQQDRLQISADNASPLHRPGAAQESLDLGHAHLRNECWAALRQRPPRPARARTLLHLVRPYAAAEARFTSLQAEFLD